MSAWSIKMMKIYYPLVISIYLILSGTTTYASDFEDTWYGFQKFLAKKDQTTWFLQCGNKYDGGFSVFYNYKLIKKRSNISVYEDIDDRWQLIDATIGASTIVLNESEETVNVEVRHVSCSVTSSCWNSLEPLVPIFREFLPADKRLNNSNFDEYFEIRNKITVRDQINLDRNSINKRSGSSNEKITVYAKDKTLPDKRNQLWTTRNEFEIKPGITWHCRSLKPF